MNVRGTSSTSGSRRIRRTARTLTLSLTTIMAVLNGIVFTALKLT
jgi:hypothetical protein